LTPVKSERLNYLLSRASVKAKGEQRILYLIWHLFTRLSGKRKGVASSHIQKKESHNDERSLDGERGSRRATTCIRATGNNAIPCHRFCSSSFVFKAQKDKVGSRQCANVPIQMSFQKSQIEKKRREDCKRGNDDIFYALLLNSLFRALFFLLFYGSCCYD
jgi:hypothetical protein